MLLGIFPLCFEMFQFNICICFTFFFLFIMLNRRSVCVFSSQWFAFSIFFSYLLSNHIRHVHCIECMFLTWNINAMCSYLYIVQLQNIFSFSFLHFVGFCVLFILLYYWPCYAQFTLNICCCNLCVHRQNDVFFIAIILQLLIRLMIPSEYRIDTRT